MFKEAHQLFVNGFEDQALSRYMFLAILGYEIANFNCAFILEKSKNPIHFKRAAFFYGRSATMGNSIARRKLGDAYSKMGDHISAVAHYVIAAKAESPDPEALFNLGYAYETGIGLKKDLFSALDMYTASLSHGKSGKIAISLAMAKVRAKLFFNKLKEFNSPSKKRHGFKSRKESDKIFLVIATMILTGVIYWYINLFRPQQNRNNNQIRPVERQPSSPVTVNSSRESLEQIGERTELGRSPSMNSDSSSSTTQVEEFKEFHFRRSPVVNNEKENEEVD